MSANVFAFLSGDVTPVVRVNDFRRIPNQHWVQEFPNEVPSPQVRLLDAVRVDQNLDDLGSLGPSHWVLHCFYSR